MKIVALAGGVGGAKLADGLARLLSPEDLTVIVNTGDDFIHFGLSISPDLDTVCYTLAGLANPETGWGRQDETWHAFENITKLGGPSWFKLGDADLGTHLERSRRLAEGESLSQVTLGFCQTWGVRCTVLPMSDQPVSTIVRTLEYGPIPFQNYFVQYQCQPTVEGFQFHGAEKANAAPGLVESIREAIYVIICPSNPWVSIGPILAIKEIKKALNGVPVVAVSPIIGGKAVKGPAAKMYAELGIQPSALAVAKHYRELMSAFVLDKIDIAQVNQIEQSGIITYATDTLMRTSEDRLRLAREILAFCEGLPRRKPNQ